MGVSSETQRKVNTPSTATSSTSTLPTDNDAVQLDEAELALMEVPADMDDDDDLVIPKPSRNVGAPRMTADELLGKLDALLNPHNASGNAIEPSPSPVAATSKRARGRTYPSTEEGERRRKSEAEEDRQLLEEELAETVDVKKAEIPPTRVTQQPRIITATMRDYQVEALNWMVQLHDRGLNGILADEMGLGKTLETISLLAYLRETRGINGKHLIIVPKSTLTNWTREVTKWCPDFSVLAFSGVREERDTAKALIASRDIIVTTYEVCIIEKAELRRHAFEYIIIDEAHRIKNENSKLSLVVRTFRAAHRLLITGTPLQNNLHELWALLNFLKPELFSSHEDFSTLFNLTSADVDQDTVVKRLHRVLRPFLLRRLKSDVATSLPPKIETKLYVGLSPMQREWYTRILTRDMDALNGNAATKTQLLNVMMQLRKVCNHPYLFHGAEPGPPYIEGPHIITNSAKMMLLDKLLIKLKQEGSRVLIFSQMTRLLDILEDYAIWKGYKYCRIDGSTKQSDRDEAMDSFNAPNSDKFIFLLSTRAGGLGINLQTADTVVIFDSDWNPQMDLQAMDRAHRIGQKKQVNVFRFVTEDSVEAKIVERATKKLALDAMVIQKGRLLEQEKTASSAELQSMIRFGAAYIFHSKGQQVTDEDIDAILARGKEKTAAESARVTESQQSLLNFSLDQSESAFNTLTFEGKDYSDIRRANEEFFYIAPPQRERNISFDENEYFREALNGNPISKEPRAPKLATVKEFRPTLRHDFQFFDIPRLNELEKKNWEGEQRLKTVRFEYGVRVKEEKRLRAQKEREEKRKEKERIEKAEKAEKAERAERAERAGRSRGATGTDSDGESEGERDGADEDAKLHVKKEGVDSGTFMSDDTGVKSEFTANASVKSEDIKSSSQVKLEGDEKDKSHENDTKSEKMDAIEVNQEMSDSLLPSTLEDNDEIQVKFEITSASDGNVKSEVSMPLAGGNDDDGEDDNIHGDDDDDDVDDDGFKKKARKRVRINLDDDGNIIDPVLERKLRDESGCCTAKEEVELSRLQKAGFADWKRSDLSHFVSACVQFGRRDLVNIAEAVEGIPAAEVRRYHKVFFQRYREIKDSDKLMKQIERGEALLRRKKDIEQLLEMKIRQFKDPLAQMTFEYSVKQTAYDITNDRYLVLSMKHHGFGNWPAIRRDVFQAPQHRFDWFIKSRTVTEITKRCEYLLKIIEKEFEHSPESFSSSSSTTSSSKKTGRKGVDDVIQPPSKKQAVASKSRK